MGVPTLFRKLLLASLLVTGLFVSNSTNGQSANALSSCPTGTTVSTASQLTSALATAKPGSVVVLAGGTYIGPFTITTSGTAAAPITLCGSGNAILDGKGKSHAFYLNGASYWNLTGFQITDGNKGLGLEHANHNTVTNLSIHDTKGAAVHVNSFSSYNTFNGLTIRNSGAEGIYIGSAVGNWCLYSNCNPDTSDYNIVENSDIGSVADEPIDAKEGSTGGQILNNKIDGSATDSNKGWVNVKGNNYTISGNIAMNTQDDSGYQVHVVAQGWGNNNTFTGNSATNNGPGYGFYVQPGAMNNVIACGQSVIAAANGYANVACQ